MIIRLPSWRQVLGVLFIVLALFLIWMYPRARYLPLQGHGEFALDTQTGKLCRTVDTPQGNPEVPLCPGVKPWPK